MNRIRAERLKHELSQEELAQMMNVDRSAVARWELGETKPRAAMLLKLSDLFGCSVDDLLCTKVALGEKAPLRKVLPPLNDSQKTLIEELQNAGYDDEKFINLVTYYEIGENEAVETALTLGKEYQYYLPIGGNAIENANDLIRTIALYLERKEENSHESERSVSSAE